MRAHPLRAARCLAGLGYRRIRPVAAERAAGCETRRSERQGERSGGTPGLRLVLAVDRVLRAWNRRRDASPGPYDRGEHGCPVSSTMAACAEFFFFFQISFHSRKSYCSAHPDPELAFLSNYFSSAVTCLSRITPKREIFNTKQLLSHYSLYQREGETIEVPYSLLRALRKQDRHAAVSKPFHPPHPQPGQPGSRKFLGKMTIRKRWTALDVASPQSATHLG